jgi:hypothetical protein
MYNGEYGSPDDYADTNLYIDTPYTPSFSEKVEIEQKRLAYATSLVQAGVWIPKGKPQVKLTELETPHLSNIINLVSKKNYYSSWDEVSKLLNPLLDEYKTREVVHEPTTTE